jgi:hypothetical protein
VRERFDAPGLLGLRTIVISGSRAPPSISLSEADLTIDLGHDARDAVDRRLSGWWPAAAAVTRAMRSADWIRRPCGGDAPPPSLVNVASRLGRTIRATSSNESCQPLRFRTLQERQSRPDASGLGRCGRMRSVA